LADFASRFSLLKYGLALVLMFIGAKMLVVEFVKIPVTWSLGVVATILAVSVIANLPRKPSADPVK
jgi:tellurite resistance protein TerC